MLQFKGRVKVSAAWFTSPEKYTRGDTEVSTLGASGRLFSFFSFFHVFFLAYLSFLIFPTTTRGLKSKGEEICGRFAIPAGWGLWGEWTSWTDRSGWLAWAGAGQGLGSPLARGLSAEGAHVPGQEGQAQSGGAQGRETVVPAPPARWRPGRGWCRCRRGPWYRRVARTGSRRGPPRSSADTKPWFPRGSARGTRCHRPCPTRGTQRKVSLGMGQILPATRLPVWASKGQF